MKKNIKTKKIFKGLISNLILITIIVLFVSLYTTFFEKANTLVGVVAITAILMFRKMDLGYNRKISTVLVGASFLYIGIITFISRLNPWMGIIINGLSIFIIIYLFTEKIATKGYLPFILLYVFMEGNPITLEALPTRMAAISLAALLVSIIVYIFTPKIQSEPKNSVIHNLKFNPLDHRRIGFAIKMAIGVTIAMFIGQLIGAEKSMWISVTVMSLTQPDYEQTKERIKYRFFGTIIGAVAYVFLFNILIPDEMSILFILVLSYVYTFIKEYKIQMIFITINTLSGAMLIFNTAEAIMARILFVIVGIIIAFLVGKILNEKILHISKGLEVGV